MLIKLTDSAYVNADSVQNVFIGDGSSAITVNTSERTFYVRADYGKGIYDTLDRLVKEINEAQAK